jgi:hypothetical protein
MGSGQPHRSQLPLIETEFDHMAMLWRVTVDGERVVGEDGQPWGWVSFTAAFTYKQELQQAAGYSFGSIWGRGL